MSIKLENAIANFVSEHEAREVKIAIKSLEKGILPKFNIAKQRVIELGYPEKVELIDGLATLVIILLSDILEEADK